MSTQFDLFESNALAATDAEVATLTRPQREERLDALVAESRKILAAGVSRVHAEGKTLAGIAVLFSGGNDSTTLAHLFRRDATHAIHANTTVGIELTREYVRATCKAWGLPLIERTPPREEDHYRALVLDQGFPGPGHHYKMFQRLKERGLRAARAEIVRDSRRERVLYVAGRRRSESTRRASIPENGADRSYPSIEWVSPLIHWTKPDLMTYRLRHRDVPRNQASDLIHMSGECLCGAFAQEGERAELDYWYGADLELIRELEAELQRPEYDHIPAYRKAWGWGSDPTARAAATARELKPTSGALCDACAGRWDQPALTDGGAA